MSPQTPQAITLPPLSSPEFEQLRSRLDQALLRLAELSASEISSNPQADSPTPSDRRAFPRREGNCQVAVCRLSEENSSITAQQLEWRLHATPIKGALLNLSMQGAAVLLPHPLLEGEPLVIRLTCPHRKMHLDHSASIIGSTPVSDGEFKVMCKFDSQLSLEQVAFYSRFLNHPAWV